MNIEILQLLLALAAAIIAFGSGVWENSRPTRAFWVTLVAFMSFTCGGFNQLQQSVEVNPLQEFARDEVRKEIVAITTSYEVVDLLSMQDATQDIKFIASLHSRIKNGKAKLSTAASLHIGSLTVDERSNLISFIATMSIIDDLMRQNGYTDLTAVDARIKLMQVRKNGGFDLLE